ncbi:hypothetical protein [Tessaracoccus massiliensis]|uniref:hypothetical protein n=1 Tax=Tessaracoccus massiliensis TaxID=1522311 RepID=UPI00111BAAB2|nr:hypothetical protein [Tessaracoccus massiliensis]
MTGDIIWPDGWRLDIEALPAGFYGLTDFQQRRSVVAAGLHPWLHRATLVHESIHAADGPVPRWLEGREERRVHRETARRMIPLGELVHVLQITTDARVAAAMLEVPVALVWARLQGLHPSERHAVRRAIENAAHAA